MPSPDNSPAPSASPLRARLAAAAGDALLAGFALALLLISFSVKDPAPYLFPRIIAVIMLGLCALQLIIVLRGDERTAAPAAIAAELRRALPAIAAIIVYIALAERLGFYAAAALAFFVLAFIGSESRSPRALLTMAAAAAGAALALYGLFSVLLHVQTPRGWLF